MAYFDKYGVEFSDDHKTLVRCPKDFQGEYAIPMGVMQIGRGAFAFCEGLRAVKIPLGVIRIEWGAFINCLNLLSIEIPDSVEFMGHQTFENCKRMRTISISCNISHIGTSTFEGCSNLFSVVIPQGVTKIGALAFGGCKQLQSVYVPVSINKIENYAFGGCDNLSKIIVPLGQRPRFCSMEGIERLKDIVIEQDYQILDITISDIVNTDLTRATRYFFFDTETTGIPRDYKASVQDTDNWPRLVQLAWILTDEEGNELKRKSAIIYPDGFAIPSDAVNVHGITTELAKRDGLPLQEVLEEFMQDFARAKEIVGHNIDFDQHIIGAELYRLGMPTQDILTKSAICTMRSYPYICRILGERINFNQKWPTLSELYYKIFHREILNAHDALGDVIATKECFFEIKRIGPDKGYGASGARRQNNESDTSDLPF